MVGVMTARQSLPPELETVVEEVEAKEPPSGPSKIVGMREETPKRQSRWFLETSALRNGDRFFVIRCLHQCCVLNHLRSAAISHLIGFAYLGSRLREFL